MSDHCADSFLGCRVFLGSMTNVINAPMRALAITQGARAVIGEMAIAHYVAKGVKQDLALVKKHENNAVFGAQIVGAKVKELARATEIATKSGADFIDFNCACPHKSVLKHGSGALLLKKPDKIERLVAEICAATDLPVSVKIRSAYRRGEDHSVAIGAAAQAGGASAVFYHARSKEQLYSGQADWQSIANLSNQLDIPVIGCGDIAAGTQVKDRLAQAGCAGVALARGAVIKPWIFREIARDTLIDLSGADRLQMASELYHLHLEYFGNDERGIATSQRFLRKHLAWMCRYIPPAAAGHIVGLQERFNAWKARDEIEHLFQQHDIEMLMQKMTTTERA